MALRALWGIYQADGGLVGELRYVFGKLAGTAHCALCDLTHGWVRKKPEWRALEGSLPVAVRLVHLNERPTEVRRATEGSTPCVVAETDDGFKVVVDAETLEACGGSVEAFRRALAEGLRGRGLSGETADRGSDEPGAYLAHESVEPPSASRRADDQSAVHHAFSR